MQGEITGSEFLGSQPYFLPNPFDPLTQENRGPTPRPVLSAFVSPIVFLVDSLETLESIQNDCEDVSPANQVHRLFRFAGGRDTGPDNEQRSICPLFPRESVGKGGDGRRINQNPVEGYGEMI